MTRFSILGKAQLNKIHEATLQLLRKTGIVLHHPKARDLLLENGGIPEKDRILIPEELVMKCLSWVPNEVVLKGRDPEKTILLGTKRGYTHNVGGVPNVLLVNKLSRKPATRKDNIQATKLLDAMPNVSSVTPLYTPQDVPGHEMTLWMVYDTLQNTEKPFRAPGMQTAVEVNALAEIFHIACPEGSATVGISPLSPLTFPNHIAEAILAVAENGLVLGPLPCPILGATAPMSISGGLTQQNAEVLATLVLAQLVHPGLPMIYKGRLSVMDPRIGLSVWGNPEIGLVSAATVEIGHFYDIPVDVYGLCTNSHTIDIQNGYERMLNALIPMWAGADEISGVGEMAGGLCSSLAQIVIDDEIVKNIRRTLSGFAVDEDALALDVVYRVMNGSQNFLSEKHTVKYLRSGEVMHASLAVRESWAKWENSGRENILEHAQNQVRSILSEHYVPPLETNQIVEIEKIIQNIPQNKNLT